MKIVICDDDEICINDVLKHIKCFMSDKQLEYNLSTYTDGNELLNNIQKFDIAFLDIEIGNVNGIDIAKKLKDANKNIIFFFITSYNKYLDDALDINILRFLEKPIDSKRFYSGMNKAISMIDNTEIPIFLKDNSSSVRLLTNDIIYIEIINRSTKIVTKNNVYYSKESIKFWRDKLVASFFYKVHTSYIINMKFITEYKRDTIILDKQYMIPVAYRERANFRRYFLNYFNDK